MNENEANRFREALRRIEERERHEQADRARVAEWATPMTATVTWHATYPDMTGNWTVAVDTTTDAGDTAAALEYAAEQEEEDMAEAAVITETDEHYYEDCIHTPECDLWVAARNRTIYMCKMRPDHLSNALRVITEALDAAPRPGVNRARQEELKANLMREVARRAAEAE